jgi:hypothetical protein
MAGSPCRFDDIDPTMAIRGNGAGSINLSGQISGDAGDFRSNPRSSID